MTRPSTRYSNALSTPTRYSLLETPTIATTAINRQIHRESLISTITLSPLHGDLDKNRSFTQSPRDNKHDSLNNTSETDQLQRLRLWRHDALVQHQYVAAAFIGDKVFSRTKDPNDAFWLAQCYFDSGHYARAYNLLKQQKLIDLSVACRFLAAQSLIRIDQWSEALQLLGETNPFLVNEPFRKNVESEIDISDGGIKLEASMCHLRGKVYSHLNNFDRAKECYQEALMIDAKCFDALDDLLNNSLMTSDEEWEFLDSLPFSGLHVEDIEFVKLIYTTRLNKYRSRDRFMQAESTLQTRYELRNNSDMLLSRAELLFSQSRFQECLKVTTEILAQDQYKLNTLPVHLTCLHELGRKNELFLLSHDMAERHPEEAVTWLAIGIYYMSISKIAEARRHFSKASVMNPRFGAAWIGFAHSFAIEGEHDQAISAYTTASRLFQGTHLPALFLGMQHLQLNNIILADEYLNTSYNMCKTDPLLLNELGVVSFHKQQLQSAIKWFTKTLEVAQDTGSQETAWVSTHANLGHAYRKLGMYDKALVHFAEVERLAPLDSAPHAATGLIRLHQGLVAEAITSLHKALALNAGDTLAVDLLNRALAESTVKFPQIGLPDEEVNMNIDDLLQRLGQDRIEHVTTDDDGAEEDMEYD